MPDDLSWMSDEFKEELLDFTGTPHVEIYLNGERYVRELVSGFLAPEDCDIKTHRRLWCTLFGHKDPSPHDVQMAVVCYCGGLAAYVTSAGMPPACRYVHIGRCCRCNAPHLPRARIVR